MRPFWLQQELLQSHVSLIFLSVVFRSVNTQGPVTAMTKLTIVRAMLINPHWIAMSFTGDDHAFKAMTQLLGRQRDYNAYWSGTALGGTGGWIVRTAWLEQYKRRFHNLERALTIAQRQVAQQDLKGRTHVS